MFYNDLKKAEKMIEDSKNPVIIPWRSGRRLEWFYSIINFANEYAIPVINYAGEVLNYPSNMPMAVDEYNLEDVDLILNIENGIPYFPRYNDVNCKIITIDTEPLYNNIPYLGIDSDIILRGDISLILNSLKPKIEKGIIEERKNKVREIKELQNRSKNEEIQRLSKENTINPRYLSWKIGKLDMPVFTDYQVNPKYSLPNKFSSYFSIPDAGYLGWAMGAAVGYKIATGIDTIAAVGDGSFIFGVPTAFGYAAKDFPVLCIIFDNSQWLASAESVKDVFKNSHAWKINKFPGADLKDYNYGDVIKIFGGENIIIERPDEIDEGIKKGINILKKEKKPVVLQCKVDKTR